MEPSETYRDRPTTARNTAKVIRPTGQNITKSAPKPVAMPLPPLNPIYTGQLCPITADAPPAICPQATISGDELKIGHASATATAPFAMSAKNTRMPALTPIVRITLVIPILPLPCSRISIPRVSLLIMKPTGIEPMRYPNMTIPRKLRTIIYHASP